MKIAITGANGYVGLSLTEAARAAGHQVMAITRKPLVLNGEALNRVALDGITNTVITHYEHNNWSDSLRGQDIVIHLAAHAHQASSLSFRDKNDIQQINVKNSVLIAKASEEAGVKRFIFLSSIKVNGEHTTERPFTAKDLPAPQDIYGQTKWRAEQELKKIFSGTATELVIVRPPLVWGGLMKGNLKKLQTLVNLNIPLPFKDIHNRRDLISLSNLCHFLLRLSDHPNAAGNTFLVSDGVTRSIAQITELVAREIGVKPRLVKLPDGLLSAMLRHSYELSFTRKLFTNLELDISGTCDLLNWHPSQG